MKITDKMVEAAARAAFDTWWDGRGPGREPSWLQTKDRWLKEARAALTAALSQGQDGAVGAKALPRNNSRADGWIIDPILVKEVAHKVAKDGWEIDLGATELVMLEAEERILTSPSPAQEAGAEPVDDNTELTPEGYVYHFIRNGEQSKVPLPAWEKPYQDAWIIEQAERLGYIRIGRDVACTVTVTPHGHTAAKLHEALTAAAPYMVSEGQPTHRHKKRGTEYALIGIGRMQTDFWEERFGGTIDRPSDVQSVDMREVAIYRSVDDGSWWVRPREEFEDGRFEALDSSPNQGGGDGE